MATDTLERVLESQFNNYLREKGLDPESKLFLILCFKKLSFSNNRKEVSTVPYFV